MLSNRVDLLIDPSSHSIFLALSDEQGGPQGWELFSAHIELRTTFPQLSLLQVNRCAGLRGPGWFTWNSFLHSHPLGCRWIQCGHVNSGLLAAETDLSGVERHGWQFDRGDLLAKLEELTKDWRSHWVPRASAGGGDHLRAVWGQHKTTAGLALGTTVHCALPVSLLLEKMTTK